MEPFRDGREQGADVTTELCVIGGGAAGISVALELVGSTQDVLLVEAGGLSLDLDQQALYEAAQVGLNTDPLQHNRWRAFGGTTGHWSGWCRPLDAIDFQARDWVPHSGWPFSRETLEPYYVRASELCQVPWAYDAVAATKPEDRARGLVEMNSSFENVIFQVSPPTRFGTVYREALERAPNVQVMLHSSVVGLELDETGTRVMAAEVRTLTGKHFRILAQRFVLAVGAVETARLLLSSDGVQKTGLGNGEDLVGRFFMQHLELRKLRWAAATPEARERYKRVTAEGTRLATRVAPGAQRSRGILNNAIFAGGFEDTRTTLSYEGLKKLYKRRRDLSPIDRAVEGVMRDVDGASVDGGDTYSADLVEHPEQAPNPSSRLRLSDARDALGVRRIVMDWQLCGLDVESMRSTHRLLAESFGARGLGRVRGWPDEFDPRSTDEYLHGGHHHMGTARMHASPREGVVDAECRVHGVGNLWIASSATFPTSGFANPTLTIVALAVRLGAKLRG